MPQSETPRENVPEARSSVREFFTSIKNGVFKFYINRKLKPYGKMTRLEIDSKQKTMRIELELDGEQTPVMVEVGSYTLIEEAGKHLLCVNTISTSRSWLTTLAREYVANRKIPIPKAASIAL